MSRPFRVACLQPNSGREFAGNIAAVALPRADALIALHACNTATDDAIAKGVQVGASLIVVAPCCHKELRPQLQAPPVLAGAAMLIMASQLRNFFGLDILAGGAFLTTLHAVGAQIGSTQPYVLMIGAGARLRDKVFPVLLRDSRYAERLPIGGEEALLVVRDDDGRAAAGSAAIPATARAAIMTAHSMRIGPSVVFMI